MKKTNSTEEAQDCLLRTRVEDQRVGDPKGIQRLLTISLTTFARKQGTSGKII